MRCGCHDTGGTVDGRTSTGFGPCDRRAVRDERGDVAGEVWLVEPAREADTSREVPGPREVSGWP